MAGEVVTFNSLLAQFVESQMQAVEKGENVSQFLDRSARQALLLKVKDVVEDVDKPKLFDRTSLKHIGVLFNEAEKFRERLNAQDHPARLVFPDPQAWFQQSYKFMFDSVSFLEIVRFFAGGKTQDEKEIFFRTLVSKLIKTQETIRTISQNKPFLERYFKDYPQLAEKYPAVFAKRFKLSAPMPPERTVQAALKVFVDGLSRTCLNLLSELDISLPEPAQKAMDTKLYYDALILAIRHSPTDLFGELGSDDYSILVEELAKVSQQSHFHAHIFLFQHIKRIYLTDWLTFTLRENDRNGAEIFYQAGKADVYQKFTPLQMKKDSLEQLKQREHLDSTDVIKEESRALNELSEDDLYALLLKMYTLYKSDDLLGDMPLAPQSLSSGGDISWDKQNMVAQAGKKAKDLEKTGGGAAKAGRFMSMFSSLKKATKVFTVASKKVDDKKKKVSASTLPSAESAPPPEPESPPPPAIKMEHTGVRIEPCFPMPKRDCLNPVPGQKQDLSFNNSDSDAGVAPLEQEYIINMFNIENGPNLPKLNKNYLKWSNTVATILKSYGDDIARIQKKYVSGVNVDSFHEEVLYLRTKENVILVVGVTQMGQGKNVGTIPNKKTAYFRLFVKGDLAKGLTKFGVPSTLKEFKLEDKSHQFKEISIPTHYKEAPKYQAILIDALASVVEGLPQSEYDVLNDENLVGFVPVLQAKARDLIDKRGIQMERAAGEAS